MSDFTPPTVILLDVDGTVTPLSESDPHKAARQHVPEGVTVYSCHSPIGAPEQFPSFDGPLIGMTGEWAHTDTPTVNIKAWALYGRSPICGPVILAFDDRRPFTSEWLEKLSGPIEGVKGVNLDVMRMIATDQFSLVWPDTTNQHQA